MLREPLLPSTGGQESNTRATSDSAESHEYRARVNLTIPRGAATASGPPPNRRASVDSANVTISEGSDLCAEADSRKRRISFGNERGEAGGSGRRGRWGSGGAGGGEGVRSPRSPGLSKQEVLGAFDAAEATGEAEADLSAHLQTDFQTVLNTVGAHPSLYSPRSPPCALLPALSSLPFLRSLSTPRSPHSLSSSRSPPLVPLLSWFLPSARPSSAPRLTLQFVLSLFLHFPGPTPFSPNLHSCSCSPSALPSSAPRLACSALLLIIYPLSHPFRPLLPPQLVLALCATLFCTTARLLCRAFDALPPSTLPSYPALARFAFGPPGEWVVSVMAVIPAFFVMGDRGKRREVMVAVLFEFWRALGMFFTRALTFYPPSLPCVWHVCARQVMVAVLFEFWGALGMCLIIVWQSALIFLPPLPTICLPSFATSAAAASAPSAAPLCLLPRHLVIAASLALVIPTVLVRSFARLTNVALSGVASSTLLCSVLIIPTVLVRSIARLTNAALSGVASSTLLALMLGTWASDPSSSAPTDPRAHHHSTVLPMPSPLSLPPLPVMLGTWASDPSSSALPDPRDHHHSTVSWSHLPMAAGIFMVSLSGHAGLPSLRRSMRTPQHFDQCIIVTFSSMFLLYATMGGFAYLYFGDSVRVLVTASLDDAGAAAGIILLQWGSVSVSLSALLSLLVAASVFTTIPLILDLSARLGLPVSSHKPTPSAVDPVADGAESVCPADGGLPPPQCSAQPVPHRHSAIAEGITRLAVTFVGYITAYLT
ncbi:unnamed protein product [Closterium sp. Naga37s-1]|nr:unnamed protein product [Closterium sp. Naga37s-1]